MDLNSPDDVLDLNVDLLDRQIVDSNGQPVCKVDDVDLQRQSDGSWEVREILVGPGALGPRLGSRIGGLLVGIHRYFGQTRGTPTIVWRDVLRVGVDVRLAVPAEHLSPSLWALEIWLRDHIIAHIPGSSHASR